MSSITPVKTYTGIKSNGFDQPYVNSTVEYGYFGNLGSSQTTWYSMPTTLLTTNGIATVNGYGLKLFKPGIYTLNLSFDPYAGGSGGNTNVTAFNFGTVQLVGVAYGSITGSFGGTETNKMFSFGSNSTTYPGIIEWLANGYNTGNGTINQFSIVNSQLTYNYNARINGSGFFFPGICTTEITFIINQDTTIYFNVFCANSIFMGSSYFTLELIQPFPTVSLIANITIIDNKFVSAYNITSSSTGQYLFATNTDASGGIFQSSNYGSSFLKISGPTIFDGISSDSAGVNLVAGAFNNGTIYYSSNSGSTWTISSSPSAPNTQWNAIASDSSGLYVVAVGNNSGIYRSINYGASWNITYSTAVVFNSIASSSNGQYLVAGAKTGNIYTSSDFGTNWASTGPGSATWSVACDSTGQFVVAAPTSGVIYTSSNYGINWIANNSPSVGWHSVASSSTGQYLAAVGQSGSPFVSVETYTSSNYGVTWIKTTLMPGLSVTLDSTGSKIASTAYGLLGIGLYIGKYTY